MIPAGRGNNPGPQYLKIQFVHRPRLRCKYVQQSSDDYANRRESTGPAEEDRGFEFREDDDAARVGG